MVVVGEFASVMLPVPLTIVQVPVPGAAALAAIVKVLVLHCWISGPAVATGALYKITSSVVLHDPFTIVQRKVTVDPTATPVIVVVSEFALVIVAVPLTTVQVPVPGAAALAAIVKVLVLSQWY
jgi:hypothetical protein